MALQTELKMWLAVPLEDKQRAELGERMADIEIKINEKESAKKAITAKYTEEIKDLESELYGIAKQFKDNTDQKETDCKVEFNTPERGKKTIIRLDLNTVAHVFDMSEQEVKALEEPELFSSNEEEPSPDDDYESQYEIPEEVG